MASTLDVNRMFPYPIVKDPKAFGGIGSSCGIITKKKRTAIINIVFKAKISYKHTF